MKNSRSGTAGRSADRALPIDAIHRLHPYCARFPSEIAETAIRELSSERESVCDPFCGSGTSLVAGLLQRRRVVGSDIDFLAGMLSEVKCFPQPEERYAVWRRRFARELREGFEDITKRWPPASDPRPGQLWRVGKTELLVPEFPQVTYWFPPRIIALLAAVSEAACRRKKEHYEQVALVSLSAAIVAKWPNTLSYAKDIDHTRPHREVQQFPGITPLETYLARLDRTIACLAELNRRYDDAGVLSSLTASVRIYCPHDARGELPIEAESQALVVTSPPYFNAVDYPRAHRMSVCWMNGRAPAEPASRGGYVGLRPVGRFDAVTWLACHPDVRSVIPVQLREQAVGRRLALFFADLKLWLLEMWRILQPGGHLVAVIADNTVKDHLIRSHAAFASMAKEVGFADVDSTIRSISRAKRRFPVGPFGFDGPLTHEHLVVLRKPRRRGASTS